MKFLFVALNLLTDCDAIVAVSHYFFASAVTNAAVALAFGAYQTIRLSVRRREKAAE